MPNDRLLESSDVLSKSDTQLDWRPFVSVKNHRNCVKVRIYKDHPSGNLPNSTFKSGTCHAVMIHKALIRPTGCVKAAAAGSWSVTRTRSVK